MERDRQVAILACVLALVPALFCDVDPLPLAAAPAPVEQVAPLEPPPPAPAEEARERARLSALALDEPRRLAYQTGTSAPGERRPMAAAVRTRCRRCRAVPGAEIAPAPVRRVRADGARLGTLLAAATLVGCTAMGPRDDLAAEVARLRAAHVEFRNDVVTGPGGSQILVVDPSGNLVELFEPARR